MDSLESIYKKIKPSIVAIASRVSSSPDIAEIIGTGFIAREDGIIFTNDHVIKTASKLPRLKSAKGEWPITVLYFHFDPKKGMFVAHLEVDGVGTLERETPVPSGVPYYGPQVPDIGIVKVKIKSGLPALQIAPRLGIEEGHDVIMSGFPLGLKPLTDPGWLHQISPTLQKGILGAMLPFACDNPHAILIDVVAQPGSSGSPIINPDTGEVIGILYGGFPGTSLSYGVAPTLLHGIFEKIDTMTELSKHNSDFPSFEEYLQSKKAETMVPGMRNPNPRIVRKEDLA